jgi:ascorbate-specific PTS system EIIC-type component UlaA
MSIIKLIGWLGLAAEGLIFSLIGFFFLTAAWQAEANEAGGLRAAFIHLGEAPLGNWLFTMVAAGLMTYGLFSLLKGCYHRLPDP